MVFKNSTGDGIWVLVAKEESLPSCGLGDGAESGWAGVDGLREGASEEVNVTVKVMVQFPELEQTVNMRSK